MSDHRVSGVRVPLVRTARQGTVDARAVGPSGRYRSRCVVASPRQPARVPAVIAATWSPRRLARAAPNWMFCVRSLPQPNGPANALDLPVSARTRRDGPGCRSTGRSAVAAIRSATRTGLHVRPKRRCPRPRLRSMRRLALSGRRQGKSCSSAAGRLRSGAAATSPPAISVAEHRVEFGVGPDLPDLLRAAAGDGDLGSPPQRLLA